MTLDTNPFPSDAINMVSISVENKHARKEASSAQHVQHCKQIWRPKLIVIKENNKNLSHDISRKSERKEWRPRLKRRVETGGQPKPPWQSIFQRLQFPQQRDQPNGGRYEQRRIPQISDYFAQRFQAGHGTQLQLGKTHPQNYCEE